MLYQTLSVDARPPLAVITLTRGADGNRVDRALIAELRDGVEALGADGEIRAAILVGSGDVFSLGWDAAILTEVRESGLEVLRSGLLGKTFQFLADSPLPIIAAINGDALSAGFELALACDLRIMSERARLGLPDVAEGRLPMAGGTQRLSRLAGRGVAIEMILTAESVDAQTALRTGLANGVTDAANLMRAAVRLAEALAARGPLAVGLAKEAVYRGVDMPLDQALRFETDLTVLLQTTADRAEGVRAFLEKRDPHFEGR